MERSWASNANVIMWLGRERRWKALEGSYAYKCESVFRGVRLLKSNPDIF